jgi:hypothetical protein
VEILYFTVHVPYTKTEGKKMPKATYRVIVILTFALIFNAKAQESTRGVGVYPGDIRDDFSPVMKIDAKNYRNLALHRPAYQSSSYDYNLTAQLITDGIKDSRNPGWMATNTSTGESSNRIGRESVIDRHIMTRRNLNGPGGWIQIEMAGDDPPPAIDSFAVSGSLFVDSLESQHWSITVTGSDDGTTWVELASINGTGLPGDTIAGPWRKNMPLNFRVFSYPLHIDTVSQFRLYRLAVNSPNALNWGIAEFGMFRNGKRAGIGGPYSFTSAWMSAGSKEEWVYVDLGAVCSFDRITLSWIRRPAAGSMQVSNDAIRWETIFPLSENSGKIDDIVFGKANEARYVRIHMQESVSGERYILSECEVFGTGGPVAVQHPQAVMKTADRMDLAGGAWRLQRESLVHADGAAISRPGFDDVGWIVATVPATVLVSYLNAGALPDPIFGDNQLLISDSYFHSDFWYRDSFPVPDSFGNKRVFLHFDGINWKADIYLNGKKLGFIEGAFTRGQFDVTDILIPGETNTLAVLIRKNDSPGYVKEQTVLSHDANGGDLGADNPTFHASVGWDWIPTIRGRNTGIWNDVYLTATGPVTIEDPFVSSDLPLPDTSSVDLRIELTLHNHVSEKTRGVLRGEIGTVQFEQPVTLEPLETRKIVLDSSTHTALHLLHPELWWPNGYGAQHLYDAELKFVTSENNISDEKKFKTGIREMSYSEDGGVLKIRVNGKRFIAKGGNWGFSESMLRYRAREYDIAVRYHKEMNFTMIRNWVGQTGDDEFYDACDKYGIMVWQDFWLANPVDGPDPNDNGMFMKNVEDFVKRIRCHPSLALYCGRNEGNPPAALDPAIRIALSRLHPDLNYISNSASDVVSGGGPYRAMPVKFYFEKRATEKLHSEMGMPNMVSFESLKSMIPDSALWPIGRMWGIHDFNLESAQHGYSFLQLMTESFGTVDSLTRWLALAQWINYQGYRAMFEAQSKNRMGMLLWMSHPAWPSMVWQTYDYYFEPTAAYFGCKKACEPLHIQWNPTTDSIEVVNYSSREGSGLTAVMEVLGRNGKVTSRKETAVDCSEDCTVGCFAVAPSDGVSFLRLTLKKGRSTLSENFYWRGLEKDSLKTIRNIPSVKLETHTQSAFHGDRVVMTTTVSNNSRQPALMVKLKVVGEKSRERILPVFFSDNYISIMPGERRRVTMEVQKSDLRGESPRVVVEGYNIK